MLRSKHDDLDNHNNISDDDNNFMRATAMIDHVTNISRPFPSFGRHFNSCCSGLPIHASLCSKHEVALLHHVLHCDYESHQKTKSRLRFFNVSYDGIKTLGASAPTKSTAATYQYQSRTFHLFKMIQNTRMQMLTRLFTTQAPCVAVCGGF